MKKIICARCNRTLVVPLVNDIPHFPRGCACGLITFEDGSTESAFHVRECPDCGRKHMVQRWKDCKCGLRIYEDGSKIRIAAMLLGDLIAYWLKRLGFRKTPVCGCSKRQEKLNRWWARVLKWWRR